MSKHDSDLEKLVRLSMAGNKRAFEELCRQQGQRILYLCVRMMKNQQDGEDAAQEVFIRLQANITRLREARAFGVWLNRLIVNTCNTLRKAKTPDGSKLPLEEAGDLMIETKAELLPEAYLVQEDKRQLLLETIQSLPDALRDCIYLYYYEDLSAKEIAEILDITEKSVSMYLYRARLKIRAELEKRDGSSYYASAFVPFSAIGALFAQDVATVATADRVDDCLKAAGLGQKGLSLLGMPVKHLAIAVLSVAVVAVGVAAAVLPLSPEMGDPQPSSPVGMAHEEQQSMIEDSNASTAGQEAAPGQEQGELPAEGGNTPNAQPGSTVHQWRTGTIVGNLFLADMAENLDSTWYPVCGATVQLYSADGSRPLGEPMPADQPGGFALDVQAMGGYRVLVTIPEGAVFVQEQWSDVAPVQGEGQLAWLTQAGDAVLTLDGECPAIQGLRAVAYYPASVSGAVSGAPEGLVVDMLSPEGRIVASTTTDAGGKYLFENPPVTQTGRYTVELRTPILKNLTAIRGKRQVELSPGQSIQLEKLRVEKIQDEIHQPAE